MVWGTLGPHADLSLRVVKHKVDLPYPTLEQFLGMEPMEMLGSLSIILQAFNFYRLSEDLESLALGLFLTGSAQTTYTDVVFS